MTKKVLTRYLTALFAALALSVPMTVLATGCSNIGGQCRKPNYPNPVCVTNEEPSTDSCIDSANPAGTADQVCCVLTAAAKADIAGRAKCTGAGGECTPAAAGDCTTRPGDYIGQYTGSGSYCTLSQQICCKPKPLVSPVDTTSQCVGKGVCSATACSDPKAQLGKYDYEYNPDGTIRVTSDWCSAAAPYCCNPSYVAPAVKAAPVCPSPLASVGGPGLHLQLPSCIGTGDCCMADIVNTGGYFANFLTSLSAALFFLMFVYGGSRYLLSFGDSHAVDVGKKAMTGAAIGMAIVIFAWTFVNYIANALVGAVSGSIK